LFLAISWYTDTYWRDEEISMQNIYHEARGVPGKDYMGWKKIQAVVFNRMADRDFPKTMFGVITHKRPEKTKYEFSWLDDPKKWVEYPKDLSLMAEIRPVVRRAIIEHRFGFWEDPTGGALAYHAVTMKPNEFFKRWDLIDYEVEIKNRAELDGHLYYTRPGDGQRSDKAAAVKSRVANVAPVPPAKPRR
jgi:hypothetical protein